MYRITRVEGAASRTDGRRVEGIPCVRSGSGEDAESEMSLNKKKGLPRVGSYSWKATRRYEKVRINNRYDLIIY